MRNIYCTKCGVHVIKLESGSSFKIGTKCYCSACAPEDTPMREGLFDEFDKLFSPSTKNKPLQC